MSRIPTLQIKIFSFEDGSDRRKMKPLSTKHLQEEAVSTLERKEVFTSDRH
jgi:hypothetical protein